MDDCSDTTTVEGTIDYRLDGDYFQISPTAGNKYELRLRSDRGQAIFTLLQDRYCASSTREAWGQTHDLWTPETAGDYWIRVGVNRDQLVEPDSYYPTEYPPENYTLQITARPDDFPDLPTHEEPATQLEPNTVHHVPSGTSSGEDTFRVRLDHPYYVIEVDGEGFQAWATGAAAEVQEGSRNIIRLFSHPPIDLRVRTFGPKGAPYTVVVRERQRSDDERDWASGPAAGAPEAPPHYCYPHNH